MTSPEEIKQAFLDYQMGQNGFERAKHWKSKATQEAFPRLIDSDDE